MKTRFVRVGNSQALMIPASVMHEYGWSVGDVVDLHPMASGVAATDPRRGRTVKQIIQKLVREHSDLIRALAKV